MMIARMSTFFAASFVLTFQSHAIAVRANDEAVQQSDQNYLRVMETPQEYVALEIASVDFLPGEGREGPRIGLIGVAHIGDKSFYASVQDLLNTYDIVLFEAIRPPGTGRAAGESLESKEAHAGESLRFIASVLETFRHHHDRYPANLAELTDFASRAEPIMANYLATAMIDPWGGDIQYEYDAEAGTFQLRSNGPDGADDAHDDLVLASDEQIAALDLDQDNLQQQLASALGLEFQLHALNYGASNWRPSDMDMNQLNAALREQNVDMAFVGGTLAGTSLPAKLVSGLLQAVRLLDAMAQGAVSDIMKIMMIELLGDEATIKMSMKQMGEGFADVILNQRNQVVLDDLHVILRDEPDITSIAVLYGAAHLPDLASRLENQLDYEAGDTTWLKAISVDLTESQVDPTQVQRMRMMVRRMMQQQLRQAAPNAR